MNPDFDIVKVTGLKVAAVIGVWTWEREIEQSLIIDLEMATDTRAAAASDALDDALNYAAVSESVIEYVRAAKPKLIEVLAEGIAELVLGDERVYGVGVQVRKPGAVQAAESVAVSIWRQSGA
ncbi:MAG: dihydroneopterin aldolase [Pseudomonadota bacterium]